MFERVVARPRNLAITISVGIAFVAAGFISFSTLQDRIDERIASGAIVQASIIQVEAVLKVRSSGQQRLIVEYVVDGHTMKVSLMAAFGDGGYRQGQHVELFIDPADPAKVTTRDGFSSEDWLNQLPALFWTLGTVVLLLVGAAIVGHLIRRRRGGVSSRHRCS